jgi:hypothetical protein
MLKLEVALIEFLKRHNYSSDGLLLNYINLTGKENTL